MSEHKMHTVLLGAIALVLAIGLFQTHKVRMDLDLTQQNNNTIRVTGKAEKMVTPDTAKISFYVTKKSYDQKVAANYVNKKTKDIIAMLNKLGIDKKDIKTTNYSLNPEYSWNDGNRNFKDYRARQNITVTVRDLSKTSKILARITEQQVDNISGPNMYTENLDEIKSTLRYEAIKDAKGKANELAKELGVKVSKIVGFSEGGDNGYIPRPELAYAKSADSLGVPVAEPEITPGEDKIIKTVTIIFKIEN